MTKQSQLLFKAKIIEAGFKDYTAFAKTLNIKPQVVSRWAKGVSPNPKNLEKIQEITNGKMDVKWFADFYEICEKEKQQSFYELVKLSLERAKQFNQSNKV